MQQYNGNQQNGSYGSMLSQFGSDPQMVRQHINQSFNNPSSQSYGQSNQGGYTAPTHMMQAGATDPRVAQQHIAQDLGYSAQNFQSGHQYGPQNYGGYGASSAMHVGASDPRVVQQHIAQDLGYAGQGYTNYAQNGQQHMMHTGALNQVMHSAPAQVQGQQGQQMGYQNQQYPQQYSNAAFSQYGTNPQTVRQHIQQDLANGQGTITAEQAGAYRPSHQGGYQGYTNMQQSYPSQGQAPYGNGAAQGAFNQFGTNPQVVRQHIQQDLNGYQ